MSDNPLRVLPPIHAVIDAAEARGLLARYRRELVAELAREAVQEAREGLAEGKRIDATPESLASEVQTRLEALVQPRPRRVLNATGVVLHTGLGRAPLPREWLDCDGWRDLEIDRGSGERGDRQSHVREALRRLTGAEDALVVNNNAAATLLTVAATSAGGEVIVARGQLVEIGGSFRMPEVIAVSGARLVEVGATNRVRLEDYRGAIGSETRAILEVHTSNYRIRGFTEQPPTRSLAELAHEHRLPLLHDVGSGCLLDTRRFPGLEEEDPEPPVRESLEAGADLVCFSGDKLLGGPQAGIVVGRAELVTRLARHPLARALRVDKLALHALSCCLAAWLAPEPERSIPGLWLLSRSDEAVHAEAELLAEALAAIIGGERVRVAESRAMPGSGSLPDTFLRSWQVRVRCERPEEAARRLRLGEPAVFALVREGEVLFDLRTVLPGEREELVRAVRNLPAQVGLGPPSGAVQEPGV